MTTTTCPESALDLRAIRPDAPAQCLRGFLDVEAAHALADAVASCNLQPYQVTVGDAGGTADFFGVNLYDTRPRPDGTSDHSPYFEAADRDRQVLRDLVEAAGLTHPLDDILVPLLQSQLGPHVHLAAEPDGRRYFAPVVRSTANGIHHHTDNGPQEAPELIVGSVVAQRSALLFLATPGDGSGALQVFHKRPDRRDDELHRDPAYGYAPAAVEGVGVTTIVPEPGDLVVFDTWNIHRVLPSTPGTRRITVSTFFGTMPDGTTIVWS